MAVGTLVACCWSVMTNISSRSSATKSGYLATRCVYCWEVHDVFGFEFFFFFFFFFTPLQTVTRWDGTFAEYKKDLLKNVLFNKI
jgi:hypothetical protein